jgi:hypothetical protein
MGVARGVARVVVHGGKAAVRLLPERVRQRLEDRFFYAMFQVTRVENDNYGRRVDPDSGGSGRDEASRPLRRG